MSASENRPINHESQSGRITERKGWVSLEVLGELVLLAIVALFFGYFLVMSFSWPEGSALLPRIAVVAGAPFWFVRLFTVISRRKEKAGTIMDLGFTVGADPQAEAKRFARIIGAIAVLIIGIWLIGFHIFVPLWVFGYLVLFASIRVWWAAAWGLAFVAFIYSVFDALIVTRWPDPLLFVLFGLDYFF